MKQRSFKLLGSGCVGCLAVTSAAIAQESALEEIVVTANKRQENISEVGMAITAFSAESLAERRIITLEDLATAVPGLSFAPSTTNKPILTLRGVGFNESSLGVYPSVSVYIDEAPVPFPAMTTNVAFDLERVEVLKGPQGTLYGLNSTGGAINYIAAKPTDTLVAGGDVGYGRFNEMSGNAYVSGPLTENAGFRIAVTGLNSDDWQKSITRDDTNGGQSYVAGRALLDVQASDRVKLSFSASAFRDKSQPQAQQLIALRPALPPFASPELLASPFAPDDNRLADWSVLADDPATGDIDPNTGQAPRDTWQTTEFDPRSDRKFAQIAVRADFDITDDLTLTSLTSYNDYSQLQRTDNDGNALVTFDLQKADGTVENFNQELRLANSAGASFRWLLGINYEDSTTHEDWSLRYIDNTNFNPNNLWISASGVLTDQDIKNTAVFAHTEFDISDNLTFQLGARFTDFENDAVLCNYTPPGGNVDKLFNFLGAILGSVPFDPIGESDCYTLNDDLVPGEPFVRTLAEDNVSWRAGLDFKASDDTLIYGNISQGYKAGSFPSLTASGYVGFQPVTQESVTAYEVGIKTQWADNSVRLNAAAFYYDYEDKQIRGKLLDPLFGVLDALVNVPESEITGLEADITWVPVDGLTIQASGTYLNSEVKSYSGFNLLGQQNDFAGDPLPFTPEFSGFLNFDYNFQGASGRPFIGLTVHTRSGSDATLGGHRIEFPDQVAEPTTTVRPGIDFVFNIDSVTLVDARLGYESSDETWKVMAWGKNITDEYYWTTVIPSNDSTARFAGRPATYGVTFSFRFD